MEDMSRLDIILNGIEYFSRIWKFKQHDRAMGYPDSQRDISGDPESIIWTKLGSLDSNDLHLKFTYLLNEIYYK